ncbi:MAG: sensor histidine kinase [Alphaproteobacteria bacterium]
MKKNKVKKQTENRSFWATLTEAIATPRFFARIFVLDIPIVLILTVLTVFDKISLWQTLGYFALIFIITGLVTAFVFKELENFISYLRSLAQGIDVELPRFHRGIFGSFRLADAFLAVKNLWSSQTMSDASILERLPDPILMINANTNIVFANLIARDFFGDDILHKPIKELFNDDSFATALNQIILEQTQTKWFEFDYQDDTSYTFMTRIERLPGATKNNAIAVVVMHDITAFKLFKQQQSDFFANASHELKTPLSILSGLIETLQGPAKDDEAARDKFLKMMAEQTDRMTHLVQDLLSLSRLQMMDKTHQSDIVLFPDLLQGVVESLAIRAANHHKTLNLKIIHDLPRFIGNRGELHQAVQNLIDNAIKYGEDHTVVTIKAHLCNGFPKKSDRYFDDLRQVIAISIHNEGNPISSQNKQRIFERFYRLDSLKSRRTEGTGLGLGIVQQIIQKHDGIVDVTSTAASGTTFTIYLPVDL